jgi:hypothetical protein
MQRSCHLQRARAAKYETKIRGRFQQGSRFHYTCPCGALRFTTNHKKKKNLFFTASLLVLVLVLVLTVPYFSISTSSTSTVTVITLITADREKTHTGVDNRDIPGYVTRMHFGTRVLVLLVPGSTVTVIIR